MKAIIKDKNNDSTQITHPTTLSGQQNADLSKFKIAQKSKLSTIKKQEDENQIDTMKKEKATKRQHVTLEYDNTVKEKLIKFDEPPHWREVLNNLKEMRKHFNAPVDSMGCNENFDKAAVPEVQRYQALISLMLSSQTKDQLNNAVMLKLREHGCTIDQILETSDQKLGELIYPVSFWKTKVKNIKNVTELLKCHYDGDIPKTVDDLCKLPGVGPKMAHILMHVAWGEVTGIGVDTHVHKISNRLGWVKTKTPEETRRQLESWLPKDLWSEVNLLMVGFGQQLCKSVKPQCTDCLNRELCPFGRKQSKK